MRGREKLSEFTAGFQQHTAGNETFRSGSAVQIFLDRLFQSFHVASPDFDLFPIA